MLSHIILNYKKTFLSGPAGMKVEKNGAEHNQSWIVQRRTEQKCLDLVSHSGERAAEQSVVISALIRWPFGNDRRDQGNLGKLVRRALLDNVGPATEFLFCLVKADFKSSEGSIFFLLHPSSVSQRLVTSLRITTRNLGGCER